MTNYDCFSDWAWGHIEDYYKNQDELLIAQTNDLSIIDFISRCALEALSDLSVDEQDEMFGFTLQQVESENLLDEFYKEVAKEVLVVN